MTPWRQLHAITETLTRLAAETVDQGHADALQGYASDLARLAQVLTPVARPDALTPAQARVLDCIQKHLLEHDAYPTRQEIAQALSYSSPNSAQEHLQALQRKGLITLTKKARGIRLNRPNGAARES